MRNTSTQFRPARLRKARGARPIEELALAAGVSVRTVQNWENGKSEPDASKLAAIAGVTGFPLDYFFGRGRAA